MGWDMGGASVHPQEGADDRRPRLPTSFALLSIVHVASVLDRRPSHS
jgi:hypothetical protein